MVYTLHVPLSYGERPLRARRGDRKGRDEVISLSLLSKRTLALMYGFAAGEALGFGETKGIGEATALAWSVADVVARRGLVDETYLREAVFDGALSLPGDSDATDEVVGAQSVLAAGVVRRPHDYNGLVDDATSIVAICRYTSEAVASGCAVAAFIAGLLDGWDMESAGNLAIAIARRGAALGRKEGTPAAPDEIREGLARVEEWIIGRAPDVGRALEAVKPLSPLPRALGVAYACRDVQSAVETARGLTEHARFTGAIAGALCAAYRPDSLPPAWIKAAQSAARARGFDLEQISQALLDLRWKRSPVLW